MFFFPLSRVASSSKHGESTVPFVFFFLTFGRLRKLDNMFLRLWCECYQEWIHVKVDSFVPIDLNGGAAYEGKPGFESMLTP